MFCVGCADSGEPDQRLVLDDRGAVVTGSFESSRGPVAFRGELVSGVYDLSIEIDGLVITALVDAKAGVIEYDGYTAADGSATQMLDDDRVGLVELRDALAGVAVGAESPLAKLRRFADTWAEFPSTMEMRFERIMPVATAWTSICSAVNTYQAASHDCSGRDWWEDSTTLDYAYVSMHAAGPCTGNADGTYFWKNGTWQCYEPNHDTSVEYAYGNCFGRCGVACGSDTQFTWDCLDHDSCVRTGHSAGSWWCDDHFVSASDDWAAAPDCM